MFHSSTPKFFDRELNFNSSWDSDKDEIKKFAIQILEKDIPKTNEKALQKDVLPNIIRMRKQEIETGVKRLVKDFRSDWDIGTLLMGKQDGEIYRIKKIDDEGVHTERYDEDDKEWRSYGKIEVKEIMGNSYSGSSYMTLPIKNVSEYEEWSEKFLKDTASFKDEDEDEVKISESTELATFNKEYYHSMFNIVRQKQDKFQLMQRVLENKKDALQQYVSRQMKVLSKIKKVIWTIELYLGTEEEIVQLQVGETCEPDIPISFRQRVLYMDEEVGVAEHENVDYNGIDFQNIEEFDEWVIKDKNYDLLIPEPRGIVILRVRREDIKYVDDPIANSYLNDHNKVTYILIKNGENIYRIYADIIIHPRLFPTKGEVDSLLRSIDESDWESDKEKADNKLFSYKQNLIMLQGLIERTPIFQPMKKAVNLFKDFDSPLINFVYDDEWTLLTDGRPSFKEWKKQINSRIVRGSRILFSGFRFGDTRYDSKYERYDSFRFDAEYYSKPDEGVYTVDKIIPKREYVTDAIKCKWMPEEDVGEGWFGHDGSHERKNKASFYLDKNDWCVLNYDLISLEDVEYYIHCRIDRSNYLETLPVLYRIKKQRIKELKWEKEFVKSLRMKYNLDDDKIIWKIVEWWKSKVIWQRPIMSDDKKAFTMITSKLKTILKTSNVDKRIKIIAKQIDKNKIKIEKYNEEWKLKEEEKKKRKND